MMKENSSINLTDYVDINHIEFGVRRMKTKNQPAVFYVVSPFLKTESKAEQLKKQILEGLEGNKKLQEEYESILADKQSLERVYKFLSSEYNELKKERCKLLEAGNTLLAEKEDFRTKYHGLVNLIRNEIARLKKYPKTNDYAKAALRTLEPLVKDLQK